MMNTPKVTLVDLELRLDKLKAKEAKVLATLPFGYLIKGEDSYQPEMAKAYRNLNLMIATAEIAIGKKWQRIIGK